MVSVMGRQVMIAATILPEGGKPKELPGRPFTDGCCLLNERPNWECP